MISGLPMGRRLPSEPARPVSAEWKAARQSDMERLGISRSQLAEQIGVTRAAITMLFHPRTKQSRLVARVHAALGLPAPREASPASRIAEFLERMERVAETTSDADLDYLADLAEGFADRVRR